MERRSPEPRKKTEITPITPDVEIEMDQWLKIETPSVADTTALGPCTGIILFHPKEKSAYGGHFMAPAFGEANDMLTEAKKDYGPNLHTVKAYLGGAAQLEIEPDDSIAQENRIAAIEALKEIGIDQSQIHAKWTEKGKNTIMRIQTKTGKVDYFTVDDSELEAA